MRDLHTTNDHILNLLVNTNDLLSNYTNSYPGKVECGNSAKWIENWFVNRATYYLNNPAQDQAISLNADELAESILSQQLTVVKRTFTLTSVFPHYFRGFRSLEYPINLTGKLVVIDGRNSSGKTSLAEAFEWLLTGQLIRRRLGDMGDCKELENCISNKLRPDAESTWVEAEFLLENSEKIKLKRILTRDYDKTKNSNAESQFCVNNVLLSKEDEDILLDEILAGNPPVLMQHSLRTFVFSSPSQRRNYFERLLRLDELAYLIEKSVVGDSKLEDFTSSTGSVAWKEWEELKKLSDSAQVKRLRKGEKTSCEHPLHNLEIALQEFSADVFEIENEGLTIEESQRVVSDIQRSQREQGFPLLDDLRPQKTVDQQLMNLYSGENIRKLLGEIDTLSSALVSAEVASKAISETQLVIAKTLDDLVKAGISIRTKEAQVCPLCNYADTPTLTPERISEIQLWQPVQKAAQQAISNLEGKLGEIKALLQDLMSSKDGLIPLIPSDEDWGNALKDKSGQVSEAALACKNKLLETHRQTNDFNQIIVVVLGLINQEHNPQIVEQIKAQLAALQLLLPVIVDKAQEYLDSFRSLETVIGKQSREDPKYNLRETWLSIVQKRNDLLADFAWERAKKNAQKEIENIRAALVSLRDKLVEARRISFSDGMTSIWSKLRSDRYSSFSRLYIPPAKGKGLPVEIEVKAELNDGTQTKEVDALSVFSESQVNILGIAAFATRSKLLGHKMIILDDPVQSMDEDHFKSFCVELLPELLIGDGQVIILTHNDTFAREVSHTFIDLDGYVTMKVRHSKKEGCMIDEGSRRVAERLKNAEKLSDEGRMEDAWIAVRKAIERLYTVTYIKHGPQKFNPFSWLDQTAEYMWDDRQGGGVGTIIEELAPGTGKRLKEILDMTASGAHDKCAKGKTDVDNAIKTLRTLMPTLKVGG